MCFLLLGVFDLKILIKIKCFFFLLRRIEIEKAEMQHQSRISYFINREVSSTFKMSAYAVWACLFLPDRYDELNKLEACT